MPPPNLVPGPGESYDPNEKPPPFGHAMKQYFGFDPDYVNLNHGSYGSLPSPVSFATAHLSARIERNPDLFMRIDGLRLLEESSALVADFIGAAHDEVVFTPNATHALNTVLRNFEWRDGDVIICTSTTYEAIAKTAQYLADRADPPRPTVHNVPLRFPLTHAEIVERFRAAVREVKQRGGDAAFTDVPPLSPGRSEDPKARKNKIVAVVDGIVANPGVLMPWKEIVRVCREEGVWSVIDAAHCIGQEPGINVGEALPDFWISNCHKWLYAKRGCAVLYVPKRNQYIIKSSIPTSHGYISPSSPLWEEKGTNFILQHQWTGTFDPATYLSVPAALAFRRWLGGEKAIYDYCHKLAMEGAVRLAEVMGTEVMDTTGELTVTMSQVRLPLPVESAPGEIYTREVNEQINKILHQRLLLVHNAYGAHYYHAEAWWTRCSAQVFNEVSDFEALGKAFNAACKEVEETVLKGKTSGKTSG